MAPSHLWCSRSCSGLRHPPVKAPTSRQILSAPPTATVRRDAALGNSVAYEVWNEPDNRYWQGSYLDYFELYKSAALGIYRAYTSKGLPLPSIGGPATSTASGGIVDTGQGESSYWMVEFLAYVATTPLEDPQFSYPSLPLDFVLYHNYTFDYANQLGRSVSTVRQWLADSGLDRNTPIALTEWGTWFDEFDLTFSNPFFERLDSEVQAAHTVAGVIMMDYYGVDYHAYSNLSDWALSNHGPNGGLLPAFHGSSDIFNHYNRPKPVFKAFRMLNAVASLDRKVPVDGLWADDPRSGQLRETLTSRLPASERGRIGPCSKSAIDRA